MQKRLKSTLAICVVVVVVVFPEHPWFLLRDWRSANRNAKASPPGLSQAQTPLPTHKELTPHPGSMLHVGFLNTCFAPCGRAHLPEIAQQQQKRLANWSKGRWLASCEKQPCDTKMAFPIPVIILQGVPLATHRNWALPLANCNLAPCGGHQNLFNGRFHLELPFFGPSPGKPNGFPTRTNHRPTSSLTSCCFL